MENERHLPLTYTTWVRGKEINFSPEAIHNVLNLRSHPLPNVASYHDRKNVKDFRVNDILRDLCVEGAQWDFHDDGRPHFLRRTDLQPIARGWYEFVTQSIMPTANRSEVNVERAMIVHSITIGEDVQVDEIIAEQFYKFINKTGIKTKLPFPGIIQRLSNEAKVSIPNDTMILIETNINAKLMERVRGERTARRQAPLLPSNKMKQLLKFYKLHNFSKASHQTTWLILIMQWQQCNCNLTKGGMPSNRELTMREMQGRGIPVTIENLKVNRQRAEEMWRVRQEYQRSIDEAMSRKSKEQNKGKARREEEKSEDED
ncbi:hypothetical protein PIB30_095034 [Stylosanthes scabra]|uniref:Putative plant transposon protein domain-containing protein n=1 Tax=Stylosanthes scabra TaxID=79078 RepID=A0ABU6SWH2_9FABA|nr:hypothetical protein [Stylosanthes scabra]